MSSSTPEHGGTIFRKAPRYSKWYCAIERGHCSEAMRLLRGDPARWLNQTGPQARTVLNAAVIGGWGDDMVEEVLAMCRSSHSHVDNFEPSSSSEPSDQSTGTDDSELSSSSSSQSIVAVRELLDAEDRLYHQTALCMAVVIGNGKVVRRIMSAYAREEDEDAPKGEEDEWWKQQRERQTTEEEEEQNAACMDPFHEQQCREQLRTIVTTTVKQAFQHLPDHTALLEHYCRQVREYNNEGEEYVFHSMCYDNRKLLKENICERYNYGTEQFNDLIRIVDKKSKSEFHRMQRDILRRIVEEARVKDEPMLVPFIFKLQDNWGMTPLHAAVSKRNVQNLSTILNLISEGLEYSKACVNALDGAGRTPLHRAAAQGMYEQDYPSATGTYERPSNPHESTKQRASHEIETLERLLKYQKIDVNKEFEPLEGFYFSKFAPQLDKLRVKITAKNEDLKALGGLTALHLAILDNHSDRLKLLLEHPECIITSLPALIAFSDREKPFPPSWMSNWTRRNRSIFEFLPLLTIATLTRNERTLQLLLEDDKIYDKGRIHNKSKPDRNNLNMSALHMAACCGYPEILRMILDSKKFDPMVVDDNGHTALHYAAEAFAIDLDLETVRYFVDLQDLSNISIKQKGAKGIQGYSGKKGCINLLLQAGVNIGSKGKNGNTPSPGLLASAQDCAWWHEKVDTVTKDAKKNLTDAANAISVTGALVATTSFMGPLQPPLGYPIHDQLSIDFKLPSVNMFIVCVSFSFYLGVASIMLSLIPSLPLQHASLQSELHWAKAIVIIAVCLLITSIMFELLAFAAATIAILPNRWSHRWIAVSSAALGGTLCLVVLCFCVFRIVRLVFYQSLYIRRLYDRLD